MSALSRRFEILVSRTAEKTLRTLPKRDRERVLAAVQRLAYEPFPPGSKKITGEDATFRIRVGVYRVIYEVDGERIAILILKIAHRKDVYR
ncbi:MAG: type II toxin-antitoxin system RelE/ParE family toxin [Deltaproteobacteria bacterium]|nr:type II toxin-antitoxin system RelE/ParE family toxin [Deltaproteobacteria bacterium]MBI3296132.1 type II toxin-antitoxin system RelE/ParE family toxin [Deltaproteobacteria bacterium]